MLGHFYVVFVVQLIGECEYASPIADLLWIPPSTYGKVYQDIFRRGVEVITYLCLYKISDACSFGMPISRLGQL